jgi:anti-sigma B factor antagonist
VTGSPNSLASPPVPTWELSVTDWGDSVRVRASGDLDLETAPRLDAALTDAAASGRNVTLDLRALTFLDSSGISVLMRQAARAERDGLALSIIAPTARVARVLDVAGVTQLLPLVAAPPQRAPQGRTGAAGRSPRTGGQLQVWIDDTPELLRIRLAGELDLGTVSKLRQAVDAYARHGQPMIIDLSEVEFIDSMGLAALVRARHRALARGARLQLVAAPLSVHVVFVLTGLHAIFDWVPDTAQPA